MNTRHIQSISVSRLCVAVFIAIAVSLTFLVGSASAVDTVMESPFLDADLDGTVEKIAWVLDENVTGCAYEAGDWTVNVAGDLGVTVTGLSCTGSDPYLYITVSSTAGITGVTTVPTISYADTTTLGSVTLATTGSMTAKTVASTDGASPLDLTALVASGYTNTEATLTWTAVSTEPAVAFSHYEVWYGYNQADVQGKTGTATQWDNTNDATLATVTTATTTITGLNTNSTVYFKVFAEDNATNQSTVADVNVRSAASNGFSCNDMTNLSVQINNGSLSTSSQDVSLSLAYPSDVTQMLISEDVNFTVGELGTASTSAPFRLSDGAGEKTVYVLLKNSCGTLSTIFATINYEPIVASEPVVNEPAVTDNSQPDVSSPVSANTLVRGTSNSAVYFLAEDGKRHVFPSEAIYMTWYNDFSGVVTITDSELADIPLGGRISVKPGTKLIKITTDPKVYAIGENGVKRHIANESVAEALFGADWADMIIDIDVTQYFDYADGPSLSDPNEAFSPNAVNPA